MVVNAAVGALVLAVLLTGCVRTEDPSGCADFRPTSQPLADGASITKDVVVTMAQEGPVLRSLDVHAGYYDGVVPGLGVGTYRARVTREGQTLTLTADGRSTTLVGPLGCD